MHILYVHQHFSTPSGATGTRSYEMAKKLLLCGHRVTMVCGSYKTANTGLTKSFKHGMREGYVDGIHVVEFELTYSNHDGFIKRTTTFLKFALRSMRYVIKANYDLIFATSTPLTTALPGLVGRWIKRKPFVFEVRDLWPELPRQMGVIKNPVILGLMSCLEWAAYKSARGLIGLSPGIRDGILRLGIDPARVRVIPNGCDLLFFAQHNQEFSMDGIESGHFLAVFTGTHGLANGLQVLIDAAKLLKDRNCEHIKIVLVGEGKLKPDLIKQADDYELKNILFLDSLEKSDISRLLARADIGLQILANVPAFYYGTSPNKFFDYIASGLPVLINYPGWLAEKVIELACGRVVSPEDPQAIADCLVELSNSPQELQKMSASALKLAQTEFDREHLSTQFVNCLEQCHVPKEHS